MFNSIKNDIINQDEIFVAKILGVVNFVMLMISMINGNIQTLMFIYHYNE